MDDERTQTQHKGPERPRGWAPHPSERMLITPLVAGLGGLLAFFTVVFIVVWLPIHTFDPPASYDWTPLSDRPISEPARHGAHRTGSVTGVRLASGRLAERPFL